MWSSIISGLFGIITKPIEQWGDRKKLELEQAGEIARKEHEMQLKVIDVKMQMLLNGQVIDSDLDKLSVEDMRTSWKDEFILIVFIIPMMMAFHPVTAEIALRGFEVIAQMPDWYMLLIVGMVITIYGMRGLVKSWLDLRKDGIKDLVK